MRKALRLVVLGWLAWKAWRVLCEVGDAIDSSIDDGYFDDPFDPFPMH